MKNIFICHRPYHILRSGDIIYKNFRKSDCQNILITYNLININTQNFQKENKFQVFEEYFSNVIRLSRNDDVSIWKYWRFRDYYNSKIEEYRSLVENLCDFDNLYFFSDLEKPIEILVGMLKEKKKENAEIIIVDEGIATYYTSRPLWQTIVKCFVVKIGGFKYINHTANYGRSLLYTSALATYPEKCVFRKVPVSSMLPICKDYLKEIVASSNLQVDVKEKFLLYLSSILDLSFGIPQNQEISVLKQLKSIAEKHGYMFYIKPHPVQDINYYTSDASLAANVVDTKLPAEVFFAEGAVIVSVASSSLINAKTQGIRAMDLSNIFGVKNGLPSFGVYSPSTLTEYDLFLKDENS